MIKLNRGKVTSFGIYVSIAIGILFPTGGNLKCYIPFLLGSMLFFNFLKLDFKIKNFIKKELLYHYILSCILLPVMLLFIPGGIFNNYHEIKIGIFLVVISPTAIGAPLVVDLINGNRELTTSQCVISNILSPITYSILLYLFFTKDNMNIPVLIILKNLIFLIFIPLLLSFFIKKFKKIEQKLTLFSSYFNPAILMLVIAIAVSSSSYKLRLLPIEILFKTTIIIAGICALLFFTGFIIPGDLKTKKTLSVSFGHKNTALAIWIGLSNFSPLVTLPAILYIIFHHIFNGIIIIKYHR